MPSHQGQRSDHARPGPARSVGSGSTRTTSPLGVLPPQPVADRDRRRGPSRRWIAAGAVALGMAMGLPVVVPALGPAAAPIEPLGGGVVGAVTVPSPTPPPPVPAGVARGADPDAGRPFGPRLPPPVASLTGYVWPLEAGRVTLPFKAIPGGSRIKDGKRFHDGLDMASFCGDRVGAAHDGVVLAAGRRFDAHVGWIGDLTPYYAHLDRRNMWGALPIVVVIDDGNGYRSIYAHFSKVTVKRGDVVKAGQRIGYEGATGHASGCHVHYGLFSPHETKTFGVRPDILKRLKLPKHEIARIDPLLVLPGGDVALRTRSIAKAIKAAAAATDGTAAPASARPPSPSLPPG